MCSYRQYVAGCAARPSEQNRNLPVNAVEYKIYSLYRCTVFGPNHASSTASIYGPFYGNPKNGGPNYR